MDPTALLYLSHSGEGDAALALEFPGVWRAEFPRERGQQFIVLAALGRELLDRKIEPPCLGDGVGGDWQPVERELERDTRRGGKVLGVAAQSIAQIEHGVGASSRKPLPCANPRLGMSESCSRHGFRTITSSPGFECRPGASQHAGDPETIPWPSSGAGYRRSRAADHGHGDTPHWPSGQVAADDRRTYRSARRTGARHHGTQVDLTR